MAVEQTSRIWANIRGLNSPLPYIQGGGEKYEKTVLFTLIIILFITNIASASGSWEGFYVAEETGSGQTSNQGNSNNNSGNSNNNNNKTPPKNNSSGNTSKPSNGSGNSNNSSSNTVKIGRLSAFSKTPHHTVIPSATNKKINQNTKNFLSNPNSTAISYVVGNYNYVIGDLNNTTNYDMWKIIKENTAKVYSGQTQRLALHGVLNNLIGQLQAGMHIFLLLRKTQGTL